MTGNKTSIKLPVYGTILTLLGLAVLCTLGSWQVQRLHWKQDILRKLEAAYAGQTVEDSDFSYRRVEGVFLPDKAILLGPKTKDGQIGHHLIVPIKTNDGLLFVNVGWTAYELEELPIYHLQNANVWFEGLLRTPGWNRFTPDNLPDQDIWYKPDLEEIAKAKGLPAPLPKMLYAERASQKFDAQFPNNERWAPNNNHLQYAIFWFTLAAAMLMIYILRFIVKR